MEYQLLDQAAEDSLHPSRLLGIEEKPFKRLTKRLLQPDSLIFTPPTALPTPPPDATSADEEAAARETQRQQQAETRAAWRSDVLLDFAMLEGSIARIQLLQNSNAQERARYAAEKERILATAAAIKDSTAELRVQLAEAQAVLAQRKKWDELAERITSNRMLRPREDQRAQLAKLDAEIAALERESAEYKATWAERRVQFGRIVEEGRQMLRLIRDEKEEAERKEGMEGEEDDGEGDERSTRGQSVANTPKPGTGSGNNTPAHPGISGGHESESLVKVATQNDRLAAPGVKSQGDSRANSRASTPAATRPEKGSQEYTSGGDTEMADSHIVGDGGADDEDDDHDEGEVDSDMEEGEHMEEEEEREDQVEDGMDTT